MYERLEGIVARFRFLGSKKYWEDRYAHGGDSGAGSYSRLAIFKANFLNRFVEDHGIDYVIEFGCGDGNQLSLATYPSYLGFDVSPTVIDLCKNRFDDDTSKQFRLVDRYSGETAKLSLSLDVIYHLVEDKVFDDYMNRLFGSSCEFVIIYSSNCERRPASAAHVRHRQFTRWIAQNVSNWHLKQHVNNPYPFMGDNSTGSLADFFVFELAAP